MTQSMTADLRAAYLRADYCVFAPAGDIELRINEVSPALDELLAAHGAVTAAFITAANPASVRLDDAVNAARNDALQAEVVAAGYTCIPGEGRDPAGEWQAEQSLLVLGITREAAVGLARAYGQNACVFCELHKPAVLLEVNSG